MTTRICVLGPSGRMGSAVLAAAAGRDDIAIAAAVDREDASMVGTEVAPGVTVTADVAAGLASCDVYIDFSTPDSTRSAARAALERNRIAAIIGTTGLGTEHEQAIGELAKLAPVVVAANFSLGVNVALGLVQTAARVLGPDWDAEIVETHHHGKRDAPSGTALALARAIAAARGVDYSAVKRHSRDGDIGARPRGEIGVSSVRGGDVVGEHVANFFTAGERLEIAHRATSRSIFAIGALRAATWVVGKPVGRYDMLDVLGF